MTSNIEITTSSGHSHKVIRVMLFDAEDISEIAALRQKAISKLGAISSSISFWGSPAWAIGGSLALGLVEDLLAKGVMRQGLELLEQAQKLEQKIRAAGRFFAINEIRNISLPDPSLWRATATITKAIKSYYEEDNSITKECDFAATPDDFIKIDDGSGELAVRWNQVVSYRATE